ncbi:hypothetical protein C7S18_12070 [Ahniella affigens]|uniref:Uncharacterized protein n=1 Tax=Ahniella affigens TaxID=2021234 RepID=A0A2P1PSQ7_9GAMM|nr:hypothetical protein [Ahniella affigens]AVP97888.1 hypothetical protein C7S18_12070 [Ahniella affigens]
MPGSDCRFGLLGVLAFVLLAASPMALADYKQDYARGQEAATDENWPEVERYMHEAMAGSTAPAVRVRLYGQRFAPYVPQYYLGLAAYRSNDCQGALRWFKDPAAEPVIAALSDFKGVADDAVKSCQKQLAGTQPSKPPVAPANPTVTEPARPVAVEPSKPPVGQGTKPPAPEQKANPPVSKPPPSPPAVPASGAPAALVQAVSDYLSGRFSASSRANPAGMSGKAKAHLHLVRAASLFALAELGGQTSAQQRAQATQDVLAAKQAAPGLQADPQFFSPRFRAFFAAAR